jgi:DNA-binding PadR family transcriptional regulator
MTIIETEPMETRAVQEKCVKDYLSLIILLKLRGGDLSGYSLMNYVHKQFGVLLSPGTIYPVLYQLERDGLVTSKEQDRRRVYSVTIGGRRQSEYALSESKRFVLYLSFLMDN